MHLLYLNIPLIIPAGPAWVIMKMNELITTFCCNQLQLHNWTQPWCRLDIRKYSYRARTINEWNKLSTDCVTASSVNMFKNKVDKYLWMVGYT